MKDVLDFAIWLMLEYPELYRYFFIQKRDRMAIICYTEMCCDLNLTFNRLDMEYDESEYDGVKRYSENNEHLHEFWML